MYVWGVIGQSVGPSIDPGRGRSRDTIPSESIGLSIECGHTAHQSKKRQRVALPRSLLTAWADAWSGRPTRSTSSPPPSRPPSGRSPAHRPRDTSMHVCRCVERIRSSAQPPPASIDPSVSPSPAPSKRGRHPLRIVPPIPWHAPRSSAPPRPPVLSTGPPPRHRALWVGDGGDRVGRGRSATRVAASPWVGSKNKARAPLPPSATRAS